MVSAAFLLESATQIRSGTRLRVTLGANAKSLSGSRVSLWDDRSEKLAAAASFALADYGARVAA